MHSDFQPIMKFPSNGLIHFLINYFLWVPKNIQYVFGYKTILAAISAMWVTSLFKLAGNLQQQLATCNSNLH